MIEIESSDPLQGRYATVALLSGGYIDGLISERVSMGMFMNIKHTGRDRVQREKTVFIPFSNLKSIIFDQLVFVNLDENKKLIVGEAWRIE